MLRSTTALTPFYQDTDLTPEKTRLLVQEGLKDADYGELYQETTESEGLSKDMGKYTSVSIGNRSTGFGFRVGQKERVGYSYSNTFNEAALKSAIESVRKSLEKEPVAKMPLLPPPVQQALYPQKNPIEEMTLPEKIAKVDEIEAYAKSLSPNITNVSVSYRAECTRVHILTKDGRSMTEIRPLVSLQISVTVKDANGKLEKGFALLGGPVSMKELFDKEKCEAGARKALKLAQELSIAVEAPAGTMDVVLAAGWPAVILHEAVGHGLEGDFNRRNISVYSGKVGEKVASEEVTVIDQGDLTGERGSLHFDDEGTPPQKNVLIEKGILKGYMQDRQNAQLMGVNPTGNGRRENYSCIPMPRMTNTYFANGTHDPADIIKSVKDGLYITDMGGGSVDITSGKFNMQATLAYRIRDGKICEAVKSATLVGDGLTVINAIEMVGNDLQIEKAAGMCGKNGQSIVVSCGQPTIKVKNMTVGGTGKR